MHQPAASVKTSTSSTQSGGSTVSAVLNQCKILVRSHGAIVKQVVTKLARMTSNLRLDWITMVPLHPHQASSTLKSLTQRRLALIFSMVIVWP
jgi:hypothetical protein